MTENLYQDSLIELETILHEIGQNRLNPAYEKLSEGNLALVAKLRLFKPVLNRLFWISELGQYIAEIEFFLYRYELISQTEASQIIFGDTSKASLVKVLQAVDRKELSWCVKPNSAYTYSRKKRKSAPFKVFLFKSEVEKYAENKIPFKRYSINK